MDNRVLDMKIKGRPLDLTREDDQKRAIIISHVFWLKADKIDELLRKVDEIADNERRNRQPRDYNEY